MNARTMSHPAGHDAGTPDDGAHPDAGHGVSALREGVVAGAIGATALALWFLAVDVLAGRPLFTPAFLGGVLAGNASSEVATGGNRLAWAALYTPVHYLIFAIVGVAAVTLLRRAVRTPALLGLLLMLFLAFAVAFSGLVAVLERSALGTLAWYQIAAGSLVAVVTMGAYLYRRHRTTARAVAAELGTSF